MKRFNSIKKWVVALGVITLFTTCSKSDDEKVYTPAEARQAIQNTIDGLYRCMQTLNDGSFSQFFYNLVFSKGNKSGGNSDQWVQTLWFALEDDLGRDKIVDDPNSSFVFHKLKATYAWDITNKKWVKEGDSKVLTLKFPSTKEGKTNNATFVLTNYEDTEVTVENKKARYPTRGNAYFTVDGLRVFEVTIDNIKYEQYNNIFIPSLVDIVVIANPFTARLQAKKAEKEHYTFAFSMATSQGCDFGVKADIRLKHSDFDNVTSFQELVKSVAAEAYKDDLRVYTTADVEGMYRGKNKDYKPSIDEVNTYVKTLVFKGDSHIADLKYNKENGKFSPDLIFSDGSQDKAEKYVKDFDSQVNRIFKKFIDNEN